MSYYRHELGVVPGEKERKERYDEAIRKNSAEYAEDVHRANREQEAIERSQRIERERRREEALAEEHEAWELAEDIERDQRVKAHARAILAERGVEVDTEVIE